MNKLFKWGAPVGAALGSVWLVNQLPKSPVAYVKPSKKWVDHNSCRETNELVKLQKFGEFQCFFQDDDEPGLVARVEIYEHDGVDFRMKEAVGDLSVRQTNEYLHAQRQKWLLSMPTLLRILYAQESDVRG